MYTHILTHQLSALNTELLTYTSCYIVIHIIICHTVLHRVTWHKLNGNILHSKRQLIVHIFILSHFIPLLFPTFFTFSYCPFLNIRNYLTVCMRTLWTLTRKRALPPLLPQTNCTYTYMHIYRDWETDHPEVVWRKTVLIIIMWRKVVATKTWKMMVSVKKLIWKEEDPNLFLNYYCRSLKKLCLSR